MKHHTIELNLDSNILLHIPHASVHIPNEWLSQFALTEQDLKKEGLCEF